MIETFFEPDALLLNLLSDASNFLVVFNSSVNCVIYLIFNGEYREVFLYALILANSPRFPSLSIHFFRARRILKVNSSTVGDDDCWTEKKALCHESSNSLVQTRSALINPTVCTTVSTKCATISLHILSFNVILRVR